uniref:Coiled-coil domain containing 57 n=1 Tax=Hippocampus comes TaxID=109280 RepID=A0A3Q3D2Q3_HIPCM
MQDGGDTQDSGLGHLEALVANKEREWKELHARRIHLLEDSLKKAKEECSSLRHQNQKLKEDFQYNLSILDEREKELERYDVITLRAVNAEQNSSMTGTIQKQTEEHERVKLEAQHRLREMEGELTRQKQEVTATCAKQLGHREHEFNLKLDEMHAALLSKDLKVSELLSKECEAQSQARMQATRALKASEELCEQFRAKLQHEVDLKNEATAVKEVRYGIIRLTLLPFLLHTVDVSVMYELMYIPCVSRNEDVTRALKEKDEQLEARCQAHKEQLKRTEKHVIKLKNDLEIQAAKALTTAQTDWERCMSQTSNEMVGKNTELITLQNRISKLQAELERSREEINRYKQDVNAGLKREAALEQARVQLELEWQERYDAVKAKHYLANEQLIQDLTLARDQGLTPKPDAQASEMNSLVEQNSFLRAVVSQMRKDMEDLGHLVPHQQNKLQAFPAKAVQASEATAAPPTTEPLAKHPDTSANTIPAYLSGLFHGNIIDDLKMSPKRSSILKYFYFVSDPQVLCLDQRAESTAMRSQAARGPHAEQGGSGHAVVQQFQDENLYRWQQQLTSALMAGAASGNVQGVKRNIALAHARLKQAASYIARLSKEKQQLIQMGNCLRARITSTGLEASIIECQSDIVYLTEAIEQKKDSATNEQHDRLSALEQLQYRLTTQVLSDRTVECAFFSESKTQPKYLLFDIVSFPQTSKMSDKTPLISQQQNSLEVKTQPSSGESLQSLKEIWEILDHGLSSSVYSEGNLIWTKPCSHFVRYQLNENVINTPHVCIKVKAS